jgi:N-acetylneuraminic acid mutarotase
MKKNSVKMKKIQWIGVPSVLVILLFLSSCGSSPTTIAGNWVNSVWSFEGSPRSGAFQFTIGNSTYVGLGYGGKNGNQYLLDNWVFSLESGFWKEVAPFPGIGRELSVSFSLGGKGYMGTGYNRYLSTDSVELGDFWQFDPTGQTDSLINGVTKTYVGSWKRLGDFPGNPRYNALAFTTSENAYVGTGYDGNYYSDNYEYFPGTDTWTEVQQFPGDKREGAMTLTLNGKVWYFGGDSNGVFEFDLWEFDPATGGWSEQTEATTNGNYNDFKAGVRRSNAAAFTLGQSGAELGYVVCGTLSTAGAATPLVYQFDPIALTWTRMTGYERAARYQAVSFVLEGRAFVATGGNGTKKYDDMSEWQPLVAENVND